MSNRTTNRRKRARRQRMSLVLVFGGIALVVLAVIVILTAGGSASAGTSQYDFTLQALGGGTLSLADYEGKIVLVNFWATWCPPCKAEMPELHQYYLEHADQGFVMIAVNVNETPSLAESFITQNGYTFPVAFDSGGTVAQQYGVSGMPTSVVFDGDGEVIFRQSGMISTQVLDAQVTPLLGSN